MLVFITFAINRYYELSNILKRTCILEVPTASKYKNNYMYKTLGLPRVALVVKNLPMGDVRDTDSIPGSGRAPAEECMAAIKIFCLVIPRTEEPLVDYNPWELPQGQTWLKLLSMQTHT